MSNLKSNEKSWVLGVFLAAVGLLAAILLAAVDGVTKEPIKQAKAVALQNNLKKALPDFTSLGDKKTLKTASGWDIDVYTAYNGDTLVGVAAECSIPSGYAGEVRALIGFTPQLKITTVLITKQNETPGLGAEVCARKFKRTIFSIFRPAPQGLPPNSVLDQFTGLDGNDIIALKRDGGTIDGRTGATVTSRAVTNLTNEVAKALLANKAIIK